GQLLPVRAGGEEASLHQHRRVGDVAEQVEVAREDAVLVAREDPLQLSLDVGGQAAALGQVGLVEDHSARQVVGAGRVDVEADQDGGAHLPGQLHPGLKV